MHKSAPVVDTHCCDNVLLLYHTVLNEPTLSRQGTEMSSLEFIDAHCIHELRERLVWMSFLERFYELNVV